MIKIEKYFKSKVLENSLWLMVLQVFNTIIPMVTIPYVTRILGASGYGTFSLALNWILYFQVLVEYGFGFWGARKVAMSEDDNELQHTYSRIITARLFLLIVSFALMNIIYFFSGMQKEHYFCMVILFLMVIGVAFQLTWLFQGKQDMKFIALVNAISRGISVLLVFILVRKENQVYLYCFLYSCTYIFSSIIGLYVAYKKYSLKVKLADIKTSIVVIKEAWPLFISQAMSKILSGFGVTVLGVVASSSIIGIYSAIYKIPYAVTLFFSPISQALYPHISIKYGKSTKEGKEETRKIAFFLIPIFIILAGILIVFRYFVIDILFGAEYVEYSNILIPLSIWFVISVINNFLGIQTLVASGHQKQYGKAFSISAILSIVFNVVLGMSLGISGIAWATTGSELLLTILLLFSIKKYMR